MKLQYFLCISIVLFLLVGCGHGDIESPGTEAENGQQETKLVLATFGSDTELSAQVKLFNETHEGTFIEIKEYGLSLLTGEDGVDALRREIATGSGPDIINFGMEYTGNSLEGDYTEELTPYIERDGDLKLDDFFGNILETFYYREGLYVMPAGFSVRTFAGLKEYLGEKESWNIHEMMQCYQDLADGMILFPGETKWDVYGAIITGSLEYYVDWEKGECRFDSQEYRDVLAFANTFPDTLNITEDYSPLKMIQEGKALVFQMSLANVYDICKAGLVFGGRETTFIGFPVEGDDGTAVMPSNIMLSISANSEHKEEAWEFISQFLSEEYQKGRKGEFPIRRRIFEEQLAEAMEITYVNDEEIGMVPEVKAQLRFEGETPVAIYAITQEEGKELMRLVTSASLSGANDHKLSEILGEEISGYFHGDKSLDETIEIIQRRAVIYVNEKID